MEQEKTSASGRRTTGYSALPQMVQAARRALIRWNRGVKLALVFFLFLIIFIVPARWLPGNAVRLQRMGLTSQQTQSASIGRLVWTWARGKVRILLGNEPEEVPQLFEKTKYESSGDVSTESSLFKGIGSVDKSEIRGVYFRPSEDPARPDLDGALGKAFRTKVKDKNTLLKDDQARKDLDEIWRQSMQAASTQDLAEKKRLAQGAFMGGRVQKP